VNHGQMRAHHAVFKAPASCGPTAKTSQSVIGEINLLMIMIPGRGRTFSSGVLVPFSENGFSKKFVSPPQN
jgi:hypothetical protein